MKRALITLVAAGTLLLAGCGGSADRNTSGQASPATTAAPATTSATTKPTKTAATRPAGCLDVPASFFSDIAVRGKVLKSGAVKSALQTANGRDLFEVAARFSDGVAVWSTGGSIGGGGPTFPMNDAAKAHSDQGVDAPSSALPDDPGGVSSAEACV